MTAAIAIPRSTARGASSADALRPASGCGLPDARGGTSTGARAGAIGRPQWTHAGAASEISRRQSGQGTSAIPQPATAKKYDALPTFPSATCTASTTTS
ncbi:MAG TPA: hypothetical protein VHG93_21660 [Longimicrobium sp.]|nr:hypothetical protein [Longimicrobium sp.]